MSIQKSFVAKPREMVHDWILIDAEDLVLGRLASMVANRLRGKHKSIFTPHVDCGDNVIIINAEKIHLTGNKREDKIYYRHTGYPGGIKSEVAGKILESKKPEKVIHKAVTRMIPKGPLGSKVLRKLYVYAGPEHPHEAQKPKLFDFGSINRKYKRS